MTTPTHSIETLEKHIREGERLLAAQQIFVERLKNMNRNSAGAQEILEMVGAALTQLRRRRAKLDARAKPLDS